MAEAMACIVGTLDTGGEEILHSHDLLAESSLQAFVVDVDTDDDAQHFCCGTNRDNCAE